MREIARRREPGREGMFVISEDRAITKGALLLLSTCRDPGLKQALEAVADLYGLTPAEARLVEALLGGETVAEYAERAGVSANTAKTQLKRVFAKTGCGRQAELVAAVLDNPVLRAARAG